VHGLLDQLGASPPRLVIGNQIDRCPAEALERARALEPQMLFVSATAALGLDHLRRKLRRWPEPLADAEGREGQGSGRAPVPASER